MKRAGYSLIEVLAALAIFALAVPGALALFHTAVATQRMTAHRAQMSLLARTVMDELRLEARLGKLPEGTGDAQHPLFPGYYYDVDVLALDPYDREWLVWLLIRWYRPENAPASRRGEDAPHVSYYSIITVAM